MATSAAKPRIVLIIPALDEEEALPLVLQDLARYRRRPDGAADTALLDEVVVVDNGSRDRTAEVARAAGATVLREPERGYGAACLLALQHLRANPPTIVLFMDADRSDDAADIPAVLRPILEEGYDFVVGSRILGSTERGAVTPQQRVGNWIATGWIRRKYGFRYTDLGPFRALRYGALEKLGLADRNFGWNVEMQVRALQAGLRVTEVPVRYRRRVGKSKISGTISGSVRAGAKILHMLWKLRAPVPTGERATTGRIR